ncbi:SRPBCC family protein [Jiangella anatolica]|uniref:ATPase n=1 Tax=Jiangella anatolica TaxID=2670374 RepID=A0A2W2BY94_9ACTN|nr:SRPBCC domain-containing protein [Jiangella anatolica]PZF84828.1 ATPase [Jiangella anatolica]
MNDFSTSIIIDGPPEAVFAAILDTRGWWNTAIDGSTTHVGDEFGFEVTGLHRTRIRVTEVSAHQRVEWLVVDNEFGFTTDQSEWVGDRIVFELQPDHDGTKVTLTQHGLMPEQECYDVCSNAWNFFVGESLRMLAEHGQGRPESNTGQAEPATRARAAADALDHQAASGSA